MTPFRKAFFIAGTIAVSLLSAQSSNPFYFEDELEDEMVSAESFRAEQSYNADDRTAIKSITNPSAILKDVRGVYYNWNTTKYSNSNLPTSRQTGIITSDLSGTLPGSEISTSDGITTTNNEAIIALLVEVVKEQNIKIEELQASLVRYKTNMSQSDHETTSYLTKVVQLQEEVAELKEMIGNPVVNVHLHYDEKNRKGKKPRMSSN